jgi:glycosyltransferase involved in cell wall biosynthesis
MNVLHLVSNSKLTGPVDPAIRLARALFERTMDSRIAVGRRAPGKGPIDDDVRARGIEPITDLYLPKHRRFFKNRLDVRRLAGILEADPVDIIHAHLDNAHGTAARVRRALLRGLGGNRAIRRPLVVRSLYDADPPPLTSRYRWLYGREADGVFVFSEKIRSRMVNDFGLPEERVVRLEGAVRTDVYKPHLPGEDLRERFGIPRSAVVVGIVARIQRRRRFEILIEAMHRVFLELPQVYFLILGRGTHAEEIAHVAVRRLGMHARTRLPGYVGGPDYPRALACFDLKVFLVPGSDGTCRAVREVMAMGIPVVSSRRGILPEIVRDGVDGLVVDDEVEPLAAAITRLAGDAALRRRMGEAALERARTDFCQAKQAERVAGAYLRWLAEAH